MLAVYDNVLPRNHNEHVEVQPPAKHQPEIHITVRLLLVFGALVRLHSERHNHGNGMQEEKYVSVEQIGDVPVLVHFDVRPNRLSRHPKRAAQSEQHPKCFLVPVWGNCINQQRPIDKERHQAKEYISRRGPTRASGNPLANGDVSSQQDGPGGYEVPVNSEGGLHGPTDASFYRKRRRDLIWRGTGMTKT